MKRHKNSARTKRIVAAIIAILIVFVMVFGILTPFLYGAEAAPAEEQAQIQIEGTVGFGNRYKLMVPTDFKIRLTNNGPNFKGKLQMKIDSADPTMPSRFQVYSTPVELPSGGSKAVDLTINVNMLRPFQTVVLLDEKGREVASQKLTCVAVSPDSIFVGVLTDDPAGMHYMRQLELNTYTGDMSARRLSANLIYLDETNLPTKAETLNAFNMLIIDGFDTTKLLNSQKDALYDWLVSGGVLVLGAGAEAEKTLAGIDPRIVEVNLDGTVLCDAATTNFNGADMLRQKEDKAIPLTNLFVEGATELHTASGNVLSAYKQNVSGYVVVNAFSLGTEPFIGLEGRDLFLTEYFRTFLDFTRNSKNNYYAREFSYLSGNLPSLNDNILWVLFAIVGVYGVFVGPILYIILKKKDMREKGFVIIPVLAVAVTLVMTVISADTAYKKPITNVVSKVTMKNNQSVAMVEGGIGAFSPKKGDVTVTFDQNLPITFSAQNYYYGMDAGTQPKDVMELEYSQPPKITFFDKSSWAPNFLAFNDNVTLQGGLDCTFYLEGKQLKGTITNNTGLDFPEMIVGIRNAMTKYEDVKAGDTITVDQKVEINDQYFDMYQIFRELYGDVYDRALYPTVEQRRDYQFKQNMISELAYSSMGSSRYFASKYAPMPVSMPSSGNVGNKAVHVSIFGFNYEKIIEGDMRINGALTHSYFTNLFLLEVPLDFSAMKTFDLPAGLLGPSSITATAGFDMYSDIELYMQNKGMLDITFTVPQKANLELFQINWKNTVGQQEIFNVAEQQWEIVQTTPYTETVADYVDDAGNIALRLEVSEPRTVQVPQIRIKGVQE